MMNQITKIYSKGRYEVWACFDETAEVFELFASADGNDYLGCADTMAEAKKLAKILVEACMSF